MSPAELEDVLQSHPAVLESLVFGLPDPQVQELFSAAVVLKIGHNHVTFFHQILSIAWADVNGIPYMC